METRLLDGKRIGQEIRSETQAEISGLATSPGLATVLVGDDPASQVYVRSKIRACEEAGIRSIAHRLDADVSADELMSLIDRLNGDDGVDGILVQLPLPRHIDEGRVLAAVNPSKDVDGFHAVNVGRLCQGDFVLAPCTPMGVMEMLKREQVAISGAEAVVVGRSDIVGKPMSLLLLHSNATVTIAHSRTRDLAGVCRRADILVAAVGRPGLITKEYIRPGAVVVDVGMNRIQDRDLALDFFGEGSVRMNAFDEKGYALVGDVHPAQVLGQASAWTPVPGGVGPLTIAHLMKNTLLAYHGRRGRK